MVVWARCRRYSGSYRYMYAVQQATAHFRCIAFFHGRISLNVSRLRIVPLLSLPRCVKDVAHVLWDTYDHYVAATYSAHRAKKD